MPTATPTHSRIAARSVAPMTITQDQADERLLSDLRRIGINLSSGQVRAMAQAFAGDSLEPAQFAANVATPLQFLQTMLPGFVRNITQARKIDELIGVSTIGSWEDEEVIQGLLEPLGLAAPYADLANIPLASWNPGYDRRTVVRFEQGFRVGKLEEARTARAGINTANEKRNAATASLDYVRNRVGFVGFADGDARTYGLLNDPNLPAYVTAATGTGGGTEWADKTFLEITADIRQMLGALRTQSGDTIDPERTAITLALPTDAVEFLTVTSEYGNSVRQWLSSTYARVRVVSAPELQGASGGDNVALMWADSIDDGSSDDGATWVQMVPARFQMIGSESGAKHYLEDFSNATAGVMLKRPYAVYGLVGI